MFASEPYVYQQWMAHIFEPYHQHVIETDPGLDDNQISIIYLDCFPVHTSEGFCSYVFEEYPYVILYFVPAGCKYRQISSTPF